MCRTSRRVCAGRRMSLGRVVGCKAAADTELELESILEERAWMPTIRKRLCRVKIEGRREGRARRWKSLSAGQSSFGVCGNDEFGDGIHGSEGKHPATLRMIQAAGLNDGWMFRIESSLAEGEGA